MPTKPKKRNPQDATLERIEELEKQLLRATLNLGERLRKIERLFKYEVLEEQQPAKRGRK